MSDAARLDRIEDRLLKVEKLGTETRSMLVGIDGQGGIIQRLEKVAAQGHQLVSAMAAIKGMVELQQEDIQAMIEEIKK